ncbi:MAG: adenylate/guanylate cyclase domain-containing protein [Betaproteobacteria bacterium]
MIEQATVPPRVTRRLSAVLFVDLVDSVRLVREDPDGSIARWRTFVSEVTHDELPPRHGRIVKLTGDGMLIEFPIPVAAVDCALKLHSRIERLSQGVPIQHAMQLRVGVHLADVIVDELDIYGEGVNLAARLMALADPGETILSAAVRDQVTDGLGVMVEDLGDRWLKGMDSTVRAFRAWPPGPTAIHYANPRRLAGSRPSIAVLPFRVLTTDPSHGFLGDLLAEDLISALSVQTDLFVISRLSTSPFRDRFYEPRNVAEILGVRYALSGTLQTSGTRVRLIAELTEVDVGQVIWADHFEGLLTDIFDLQDNLSRDITARVAPLVRQRELARARAKRPENLTAYERTLRAVDHLHRSSPEDLAQARQLLEAAIQSDPNYAAPHAWLARYYVRRVGQGWSANQKEDTEAAYRHAEAAVERDETDSWVLSVNGLVAAYLDKDLEKAMGIYDRALTINPSNASAWVWSTSALAWLGRGDEAVLRAPRAIELSPFDPNMYSFTSLAGVAHLVAGDYAKSIELSRMSLRQNAMYTSTHKTLSVALALDGQIDDARIAVGNLLKLDPALTVRGFLQQYPGRATEHAPRFAAALASAGLPP